MKPLQKLQIIILGGTDRNARAPYLHPCDRSVLMTARLPMQSRGVAKNDHTEGNPRHKRSQQAVSSKAMLVRETDSAAALRLVRLAKRVW